MKNRIIKWLGGYTKTEFEVNKTFNIVEVVRELLKGIKYDPKFIENMSENDRNTFLRSCYQIYHEPAFKICRDYLASQQVEFTAKQALNIEEMSFGRATINGISLFYELIENGQLEYLEKFAIDNKT